MPRPTKGARLYLRKRKGRAPVYVIRDEGGIEFTTGTECRRAAETALSEYIAAKQRPSGPVDAAEMTIATALTIYAEEHAPYIADPARVGYAIDALEPFWGALPVSSISGPTCRRYVAHRGVASGTVRRELGILQAALNYCAREGYLLTAPDVWQPAPSAPRDRWLTRQEASWLLRAARSLNKDGRHLAKFILISLYTGTRKSATLSLRIDQPSTSGGWIDTDQGVIYRNPQGRTQTNKRQTPARLPRQALAHVKRWKANGCRFVVETDRGNRVSDIRKGWARAVVLAESLAKRSGIAIDLTYETSKGREYITPHILKHTAVTWALQNGADLWDAASFFGTSIATLEKTYGHHHPDHQGTAVRALETRR